MLRTLRTCLLLALLPFAAQGGSTPRECPCTAEKLWLDIIFVVDASGAVGELEFDGVQEFINSFVNFVTIGQGKGQTSRIAYILASNPAKVIGNLTTYKTKQEASDAIRKVKFSDGDGDINIRSGLLEAHNMINQKLIDNDRPNVHNVIIYIGPDGYDCSHENVKTGDKGDSGDESAQSKDPCTVAAQIVGESMNTLLTISVSLQGVSQAPIMNFGSKCFALTNEHDDMAETLVQMLCKANCYCLESFVQMAGDDECDLYGECVVKQAIPTGYLSAQIGCQLEGLSLADVRSEKKDLFLNKLANDGNSLPYWLGLKRNKHENFVWDNEAKKLAKEDFTNWAADEPNAYGSCVSVQQQRNLQLKWQTGDCTWDNPSYYYFCQKNTCDTDNYCE